MTVVLIALAAILALIGVYFRRRFIMLPEGELIYSDTERETISEPITSVRLKLTGKPDYVYRLVASALPVEIKSRKGGRWGPRQSEIIQLMAYCALIEDVWGIPVDRGILEYRDRKFTIHYGSAQREMVIATAEQVRRFRLLENVPRSHSEPGKCASCGFSRACGQSIAR